MKNVLDVCRVKGEDVTVYLDNLDREIELLKEVKEYESNTCY